MSHTSTHSHFYPYRSIHPSIYPSLVDISMFHCILVLFLCFIFWCVRRWCCSMDPSRNPHVICRLLHFLPSSRFILLYCRRHRCGIPLSRSAPPKPPHAWTALYTPSYPFHYDSLSPHLFYSPQQNPLYSKNKRIRISLFSLDHLPSPFLDFESSTRNYARSSTGPVGHM